MYPGGGISGETGFKERTPISYGVTFSRTPSVVTAIRGIQRDQQGTGDQLWGAFTAAQSVTESEFQLYTEGRDTQIRRLDVSWIACA